jgi:hypothetical protein
MQELPLTWGRFAKIFWAWLWRGAVMSVIVGVVAGIFVMIINWLFGLHAGPDDFRPLGVVIGLPIWFFNLRLALLGTYSDFRLAVVYSDPNEAV